MAVLSSKARRSPPISFPPAARANGGIFGSYRRACVRHGVLDSLAGRSSTKDGLAAALFGA
jgi:hypothetical protein